MTLGFHDPSFGTRFSIGKTFKWRVCIFVALVLCGLCCLYGGALCAVVLLGLRVCCVLFFVVFMWCLLVSLRALVLCINSVPYVLCFGDQVFDVACCGCVLLLLLLLLLLLWWCLCFKCLLLVVLCRLLVSSVCCVWSLLVFGGMSCFVVVLCVCRVLPLCCFMCWLMVCLGVLC